MMFFHLSFTLLINTDPMENVIEEPTAIGFDNSTREIKIKKYIRAYAHDDRIELRSAADGGSLIVLEDVNPFDEWAMVYTIKNPKLKFPEKAGVYLWYTDHPINEGLYSGSDSEFIGLMVGIEFLGRSMSIVIAINDGENDYSGLDSYDLATIRDSMDPDRIHDYDTYKIKIISTKKNFKIEIYNENKLLYDSFRHLTQPLADMSSGKYFSITSDYEKVSHTKHLELLNLRLYKRTETDKYDIARINAPLEHKQPRMYDHIDHPSRDVQHLLSSVEHAIKYAKHLLGKPAGLSIFEGLANLHQETTQISTQLNNLEQEYKSFNERPANNISDLSKKVVALEDKLRYINDSMDSINKFLQKFDDKHAHRSFLAIKIVGVGLFLFVFIWTLKSCLKSKKTSKHE